MFFQFQQKGLAKSRMLLIRHLREMRPLVNYQVRHPFLALLRQRLVVPVSILAQLQLFAPFQEKNQVLWNLNQHPFQVRQLKHRRGPTLQPP